MFGMRGRSGGARPGERLQVAGGDLPVCEVREAVEGVRAEEVAREVVEDLVLAVTSKPPLIVWFAEDAGQPCRRSGCA